MSKKQFNGKAIYNPSGKAGEYSYWACNFYTGCSNNCDYCYCKKGVMSHVWNDTAKLKKCFKDEDDALRIFKKELLENLAELQTHGLFFTFTSDPMLYNTINLTWGAIVQAVIRDVPVKVLTKRADFVNLEILNLSDFQKKPLIAWGFTLTGHDELEQGASTNKERIATMKQLHEVGFKTWASIEPIVDLESSLSMINKTIGFCDLYKVGLMSGRKYDWRELRGFMLACASLGSKFYFKDSFINQAALERDNIPANCVSRDYNMFNV